MKSAASTSGLFERIKFYSTEILSLHITLGRTQSLYRSRIGSHFYGKTIRFQIWADFGPVGNTEKKLGPILSYFLGLFEGKKKFKSFEKIF